MNDIDIEIVKSLDRYLSPFARVYVASYGSDGFMVASNDFSSKSYDVIVFEVPNVHDSWHGGWSMSWLNARSMFFDEEYHVDSLGVFEILNAYTISSTDPEFNNSLVKVQELMKNLWVKCANATSLEEIAIQIDLLAG
jgi:hypothetical protein